ncbi:MAG: serine hydrolase [Myxococcales bacterium]|nr:serine hydrolase [Myxococcales bacterium]
MIRRAALLALCLSACSDPADVARGDRDAAADAAVDAAADADPFPAAHDATVTDWSLPPADTPPDDTLSAALADFEGGVAVYARNQVTGDTVLRDARRRVWGGSALRLVAVVAWSAAVADGRLAEDATARVRPELVRGSAGLGDTAVGAEVPLRDAARAALLDADLTAEALLVDALGGEQAVADTLASLGLAGMGAYRAPCARARALATALDPRASAEGCVALSAWIDRGDASGLGFEPAPMDAATLNAAVATATATGQGTVTAGALGGLLARLDAYTLLGPAADAPVRALLDESLGAGGGADDVPLNAWAGSLEGGLPLGRHWLGLLRGAGDPLVLVVLTDAHVHPEVGAGQAFRAAGRVAWAALVGDPDAPPPPAAGLVPRWFTDAVLVEAGEAAVCDGGDRGFDDALDCRRQRSRGSFEQGERSAATIYLRTPPPVDVAWIWSAPDGRRHRYQVHFGPDRLWIWTRALRVSTPGDWGLDVLIDGVPRAAFAFPVR